MTEKITRESFIPHLNSEFQLERGFDTITLELIEVSELRSSRHHESFSLVFRGPGDAFLAQSTYRLCHSALGAVELFLVPIRQDTHGLYYEAVISRLREEGQH